LYSVVDYDDNTALASVGAATDYSNCVTCPQSLGVYRHFKPHCANALYGGSVFTSYGNLTSPWIDAASSSVPHYGVKIAASATSSAAQTFDLVIRLHTEWKSTR
jgi:hypothetical protein